VEESVWFQEHWNSQIHKEAVKDYNNTNRERKILL
jgi:hypothetical protein